MNQAKLETSTHAGLPDHDTLQKGLASLLSNGSGHALAILQRDPNTYQSTFNSEMVTCQIENGKILHLFIKYGPPREDRWDDYRGSVKFEADVYRDVLQMLSSTTARYFGTVNDDVYERTWLVISYLVNAYRIIRIPRANQALLWSAQWLGDFHAKNSQLLTNGSNLQLRIYSADYYLDWVAGVEEYIRPLRVMYPWLPKLLAGFRELIAVLTSEPFIIIHGEYYPENILVKDEVIYPVDWQTAAVARGEIDLASLIDGWNDEELIQRCLDEYCLARWNGVTPADFSLALSAAQIYWHLKWLYLEWLSRNSEWATDPSYLWRIENLRIIGECTNLIG